MQLLHVPNYAEINDKKKSLIKLSYEHWIKHDLFSFNWWILLIATIIPYFIWWKIVDKNRFYEIFSYGLLCASFAIFLDVIGTEVLLWGYPDKLFPLIPPLIPADLVIIPITAMIIYQYCTKWRSFILATIGWAVLFAYIIEPTFVYANMFVLGKHWTHTYSFIGFILFGIILKSIFSWLQRAQIR